MVGRIKIFEGTHQVWPDSPIRHDSPKAQEEQVKISLEMVHSLTASTFSIASLNLEVIIDSSRYNLKLT